LTNGDVDEGERENGKMHGDGTYTWANGNTYNGEWKDDKMHGKGKMEVCERRFV